MLTHRLQRHQITNKLLATSNLEAHTNQAIANIIKEVATKIAIVETSTEVDVIETATIAVILQLAGITVVIKVESTIRLIVVTVVKVERLAIKQLLIAVLAAEYFSPRQLNFTAIIVQQHHQLKLGPHYHKQIRFRWWQIFYSSRAK